MDIQNHLSKMRNSSSDVPTPESISVVHLGTSDTYIASYKSDEQPTIAVLKRGINGRLKIVVRYSGTSLVKYRSVETNEGFYGIIHGINPDYKINSIRVKLQGTSLSYMVKIPKEFYFTVVNRLPSNIKSRTFADLYLYDKNQEELFLSN